VRPRAGEDGDPPGAVEDLRCLGQIVLDRRHDRRAARIGAVGRRVRAGWKNTSPGTTTTATPRRSTAARIAVSSTQGSWEASQTNSEYTLHSRKSSCVWVSWRYPDPISASGM
jgi:hypothetical protein